MIKFDRHIEILLLNNDCVIIPNFGGFMAHYVEARKDERDCAFLPPMRTIGFNPKLTLNDSLLAQSYVEVYDISYPDAVARIEDEVRELKQRLANDEQYEMNSIGVLRLNASGAYEFEPCSAGILTPSLYALGYYEFKTLAQIEHEQLAALGMTEVAESQATAQPITAEAQEQPATPIYDIGERPNRVSAVWRNVAVASVAFIAFLLIPAPLANNDAQLSQTKVNTRLLEYVMPKEITTGERQVEEVVKAARTQALAGTTNTAKPAAETSERKPYTIVVAARITHRNAKDYVSDLHRRGMKDAMVYTEHQKAKVVMGNYATQAEAQTALGKLRGQKEFEGAWVLKMKNN